MTPLDPQLLGSLFNNLVAEYRRVAELDRPHDTVTDLSFRLDVGRFLHESACYALALGEIAIQASGRGEPPPLPPSSSN